MSNRANVSRAYAANSPPFSQQSVLLCVPASRDRSPAFGTIRWRFPRAVASFLSSKLSQLLRVAAKKPGDTAGLEFHAAMMDTYRWIEGIMSNALAEALPVNEVAYFRGVASRSADAVKDQAKGDLNPLWDLQPREVKDVIKDAKEKNKSGLEAYGWVL